MKKEKSSSRRHMEKIGLDLVFVTLGCLAGAFATIGILIPYGLSSGGLTGIVRIIQGFLPLNYSILFYAGSLLIFTLCWITMGFREARKILLLTVLYPLALMLFEQFDFTLLEEEDIFLAVIYYGVLTGISNGLVFSRGYSFGGTDTIAKIIKKKFLPQMDLSKILLGIDAVVIIGSGLLFGRNIALYALVTQVILTKVTEIVLYGFETKVVQMEVITEKQEEVADYIMHTIGRGVTHVDVVGGYTGKEKNKLITLCSPRESMLIKQFIAGVDPRAFVTVIRVETVWGYGSGFSELSDK
ncbi:MAG: YitT family protein [Anaerovoracaceae bacterium]|nr:YitT family protein [Bacillota bacterium]MDY3954063.1 YitT family protein [Anaerovoracaceae bacterium]